MPLRPPASANLHSTYTPAFPAAEYRDRLDRLRGAMEQEAWLLTSPALILWACGYRVWSLYQTQCIVVFRDGGQLLMVREMDAPGHRGQCPHLAAEEVLCYRDDMVGRDGGAMRLMADHLLAAGVRCIGLDQNEACVDDFLALREQGLRVENVSLLTRAVVATKSPRELAVVRAAARVADKCMRAAVAEAVAGRSGNQIASTVQGLQARWGTPPPIPSLIQVNEDAAHTTWNSVPLRGGDVIRLELCGSVEHYCCPVVRTVYVPRHFGDAPPPALLALHSIYQEGLQRAVEATREGVRACEVHAAFAAVLASHGLCKTTRVGYSFGIAMVRDWGERLLSITPTDPTVLRRGMTLHYVCGCGDLLGVPGVWLNLGETLVVGEARAELLCATPRGLLVGGAKPSCDGSLASLSYDSLAHRLMPLPPRVRWWLPPLQSAALPPPPLAYPALSHHRSTTGPTPLVDAVEVAKQLNLGRLWIKDEARRFMGSFKSLGTSWAVHRLKQRGRLAEGAGLVCASDGNHGLSLAAVARREGHPLSVVLPSVVPATTAELLRREGAEVYQPEGLSYEEAVRLSAAWARERGLLRISDQSAEDYVEIPQIISEGYLTLFAEVEESLGGEEELDYVVIQAGVGGLAAAACRWLQMTRREATTLVVVEPAVAACLQDTVERRGTIETLEGSADSACQGCNCERASVAAWRVLRERALVTVAVEDHWAHEATRMMTDAGLASSPTGSCGLGGVVGWLACEECPLFPESRVLVINTEDGRLLGGE